MMQYDNQQSSIIKQIAIVALGIVAARFIGYVGKVIIRAIIVIVALMTINNVAKNYKPISANPTQQVVFSPTHKSKKPPIPEKTELTQEDWESYKRKTGYR